MSANSAARGWLVRSEPGIMRGDTRYVVGNRIRFISKTAKTKQEQFKKPNFDCNQKFEPNKIIWQKFLVSAESKVVFVKIKVFWPVWQ